MVLSHLAVDKHTASELKNNLDKKGQGTGMAIK